MALTKKQRKDLNNYFITHPRDSDREIGKRFKLTHNTIGKYRKEFWEVMDKEFMDRTIKSCIFEMRRSEEHWKLQIQRHQETLEKNKKTVVMNSDGRTMKTEVELEPMERLRIEHEISDLERLIQEWSNNPQIIQLMKQMSPNYILVR